MPRRSALAGNQNAIKANATRPKAVTSYFGLFGWGVLIKQERR
jgi:hypothetical protein